MKRPDEVPDRFFTLLGVDRDTPLAEANKKFRVLARACHPDINFGDKDKEEQFKRISEAWDAVQRVLPKTGVAFPTISADDPDFEDVIGKWWADTTPNVPPSREQASAFVRDVEDRVHSPGLVPRTDLKDWRRQRLNKRDTRFSLEKLTAAEAAALFQAYPNAFAALKVLELMQPSSCLYSVVKEKFATSTAVALLSEPFIEHGWKLDALKDPFTSIDAARDNVNIIAPHLRFDGAAIDPRKLTFDLSFLREYIRDQLVPRLSGRNVPASGTDIVRR